MIHTGLVSPKLTGRGSTPKHEHTGRESSSKREHTASTKHDRTERGSHSSDRREPAGTGRDATGGMFGPRVPTDRDIELKTSYPDGLEKLQDASYIIQREKTPFDETTLVDPISRKPRKKHAREAGVCLLMFV